MMKRVLLVLVFFSFLVGNVADSAVKASKKTNKVVRTSKSKTKKRQYVDLEGLDITGLIDRPRTLYIIKKSEIDFRDNFADYDYVDAIIEPTYSEPF